MITQDVDDTSRQSDGDDPSCPGASPAIRWVFPDVSGPLTWLSQDEIVLGRDVGCGGHLPGHEISRRHAAIRRAGTLLTISDLGSTNGVFVNGARVDAAPLAFGDVLRIGEWIGVLVMARQNILRPGGTFAAEAPSLVAGPGFAAVLADVRTASPGTLPIIIEGETGTGKESVARAIHLWSGRQGRFVALNCAALPEALAEAELFGFRRGAFTGADRDSRGLIRAAAGGTLLLDEIVDLSPALQAKLLRAIESREVTPLGETIPVPIDVRMLAAAQSPLSEAVRDGRFRPDLLARLDGMTVRLPPLRQRRDEIPALFQYFAEAHGATGKLQMSPRFVERLCVYDWPFNARELDHLAHRMLTLHGREPYLRRSHLPQHLHTAAPTESSKLASNGPELEDLLSALRRHNGNVTKTAAEMRVSRQHIYRLMGSRGDWAGRRRRTDDGGGPGAQ